MDLSLGRLLNLSSAMVKTCLKAKAEIGKNFDIWLRARFPNSPEGFARWDAMGE